jgi:hypothetical protein
VKLPAAIVVELVELVLQIPLVDVAVDFIDFISGKQLKGGRPPWEPVQTLAPVHVKALLALLQGPVAAAAAAAYLRRIRLPSCLGGPTTSMVWLAKQPGAAAAAAELGLAAADVRDPPAVALLFGGQRDQADE